MRVLLLESEDREEVVLMSQIKIFEARAQLDDDDALSNLLRPIREAELLRTSLLLGKSGRRQGYDETTRTARYIVSDGKVVVCFTVTNVSLRQSAEIATECDSITEWGSSAFRAAVERAMGTNSDTVN